MIKKKIQNKIGKKILVKKNKRRKKKKKKQVIKASGTQVKNEGAQVQRPLMFR